ncbi:MAG: glycosyltransferase family 2 protein [Prevotellaceae bacterium]|nr:glycosyltransferase family 2 protein [Prevotellaceae bacterium]
MKLSVVIVSYNVSHYLLQCLDSLQRALRGIDGEVIVVDNHSRDNSVALVHQAHPEVKVIENLHNLGFSKANNIALRQAKGEYALLLNPDTIVADNTIRDCIAFLDLHPDAGAAGVMMLNADGTVAPESRRGVPTPLTSFYKLSGLCRMFPRSPRFGRYYLGHLPWQTPQQIDIVSGAFCMLRRSVLDKVGLLDEDYFMYGEDIDLSYRILKQGATNWYLPYPILHYKGESTQKSSFRYVHVFYQAMLIFFRKHFSHLGLLVTLPIKTAIWFKALVALVAMLTNRMRRSLGFVDRHSDCSSFQYLCFGSRSMVSSCGEILGKHGLRWSSYDSSDPIYINKVATAQTEPSVIVLDPQRFSFAAMLSIMRQTANSAVLLGTFQPFTKSIITSNEIIR